MGMLRGWGINWGKKGQIGLGKIPFVLCVFLHVLLRQVLKSFGSGAIS
jgi:hypothetical protein